MEYDGLPRYYANLHPSIEDDEELNRRLHAVVDYIKQEYEPEDFIV